MSSIESLEHDVLIACQERRSRATGQMLNLCRRYKRYITLGLRAHFHNLIGRSLARDPSGRGLDSVITEIEGLLVAHKRRCDSAF